MKVRKFLYSFMALAAMFIVFQACDDDDDDNEGNCGETNISERFSNDSHNNGQNCFTCHNASGPGEGCFKVAGSLYDTTGNVPRGNGTIKLTTGFQGTGDVVATIEVDAKGNFHTTNDIDWGLDGLHVQVVSANGNTYNMATRISEGSCNSCHNPGMQGRIKID